MKQFVLGVGLFLFLAACGVNSNGYSQSLECTGQWQAWSAKPGHEGAFPDSHVSYYRYTFEVPKDRKIVLRVSARFPVGRYMGFNIYNTSKMNSVAGIADHEIEPDAGYQNPYRSGKIDRNDRYTLWMNPHDPAISQSQSFNSVSVLSDVEDGSEAEAEKKKYQREIWYRIYDPTDGPGGDGNVELPKIEAFDQATGQPIDCPPSAVIPVPKGELNWDRLWAAPPGPESNGALHFVHHKGMGLYANRDTDYVAARLKLLGADDEVVILKFRAPKSAHSIEDLKDPQSIEVRYWSFCIGAAVTTITTECLADRNALIDSNGFVKIVIAPSSVRQLVENANFMERPLGMLPVLIYRNLIARPDFVGAFSKVPFWRSGVPFMDGAGSFAADKFIGDFAPVGHVCSIEQFKKNRCQQ